MGKTPEKSTMTDREIYEIGNFEKLHNANLSAFSNVWVKTRKCGIIKGKIVRFPLDGCNGRTEIRLENGMYVYANRYEKNNNIKERR